MNVQKKKDDDDDEDLNDTNYDEVYIIFWEIAQCLFPYLFSLH